MLQCEIVSKRFRQKKRIEAGKKFFKIRCNRNTAKDIMGSLACTK